MRWVWHAPSKPSVAGACAVASLGSQNMHQDLGSVLICLSLMHLPGNPPCDTGWWPAPA